MTTITLSKPIKVDGAEVQDLTFREAETGDLMLADKFEGQLSKTIVVLASMAGIPLPAFKTIKARDLGRIIDGTKDLVGNGQDSTTGD